MGGFEPMASLSLQPLCPSPSHQTTLLLPGTPLMAAAPEGSHQSHKTNTLPTLLPLGLQEWVTCPISCQVPIVWRATKMKDWHNSKLWRSKGFRRLKEGSSFEASKLSSLRKAKGRDVLCLFVFSLLWRGFLGEFRGSCCVPFSVFLLIFYFGGYLLSYFPLI